MAEVVQTEPSFFWTRWAAFISLGNLIALPWFRPETPAYVYYCLLGVIAVWGLGSNGRMALAKYAAEKFK